MSTRGATAFEKNEEIKTVFSPRDSYPTGLGIEVCSFIKQTLDSSLEKLWDNITAIKPEETKKLLREEGCEELEKKMVETENDLFSIPKNLVIEDATDFLKDTLFCEWVYMVDIDEKILKIYSNRKEPNPKENLVFYGRPLIYSITFQDIREGSNLKQIMEYVEDEKYLTIN